MTESILSKIASYKREIERLQQEVASLEREHEKEILAAALRDRQEAGLSGSGASGFENFVPKKQKVLSEQERLIEAALKDRESVEGVEGV